MVINKKIKMLTLLIAALLIVPVAFSACGIVTGSQSAGAEDASNVTQAPEGTADEETEEATGPAKVRLSVGGTDISEFVIVHDGTNCAKSCARSIRSAIYELTKCSLTVKYDTASESDHEILVGKTNRTESKKIRDGYSRPNVYYDIAVSGKKLVMMAEGYATLNKIEDEFKQLLGDGSADISLEGKIVSGEILSEVDPNGVSMVNRADGTDLRVFHWNMAAPYLDPNVTTPPVVYSDNTTRGEVMADLILQLMPDIITTNEFYASHNGSTVFYDAVMGALGDYYVCLDSPYDKDKPEAGADAISGKTINSNIIYRKDIGLKVERSAWRYSTEKTSTSAANPGGYVYYHGSHTALFSQNGRRFILSTSHYADSRTSSKWAREHLAAIADMQAASSAASPLPVILTGDLYTGFTSSSPESGYKFLVASGYVDSQRNAEVNANGNKFHGTFHKIGVREIIRISEDFVWHTGELRALCFKVLTSQETDDTSDHYPVIADLKFN